jgi:hypothetical protein
VADKLGIPVKYVRRMHAERPDLFDANVNGWLQGDGPAGLYPADGRKFYLRAFQSPLEDGGVGIARSLQSDRYARTDHLDVLFAAMEGVNQSGVPVEFAGGDLSEKRMVVKFNCPAVEVVAKELCKGYRSPYNGKSGDELPLIQAGFQIENSETGGGASVLRPRFMVEVCTNGLVQDIGKFRRIHLGGQQDEGIIKVSEDTERKRLAVITAEARDAVATFLDVDFVKAAVAEIEEKTGKPIVDPTATVEAVGKALNFSEEARAGIMDAFIRGGQVTAGGVLQAVTAYAQQVSDPDVAYDLESNAMAALELAYAS